MGPCVEMDLERAPPLPRDAFVAGVTPPVRPANGGLTQIAHQQAEEHKGKDHKGSCRRQEDDAAACMFRSSGNGLGLGRPIAT